ncbi:MAG: NAD(P)H-binding protein [Prevotellaceae bacterium]|jgi:uncharacterized protein YbjT (DUF2867 family)|nr:NAD(P)H-binding protein [Prevotellaceae bacterium]
MKKGTVVVLGAGGQVGSMIVQNLTEKNVIPKAVIRNKSKEDKLRKSGAEVCICDLFDATALEKAISDATSLFVLTPENPFSQNPLLDTEKILTNIYNAVKTSSIKKIVGLSSGGAHLKAGSGNLLMSRMLEDTFVDLNIRQTFIRPAYYYSNWIGYLDMVKENGILPTFYPPNFQIQMVAPADVAQYIADVLCSENNCEGIYEVIGSQPYSSNDIANAFGNLLNKDVAVSEITPDLWGKTLQSIGFSPMATQLMIEMTDCVIKGKTASDLDENNLVRMGTTFDEYLRDYQKNICAANFS